MIRSNISIPYDNIFKFYAIVGLVLMVAGSIFIWQSEIEMNKRFYDRYEELSSYFDQALTQEERARKARLEIELANEPQQEILRKGVFFLIFGLGSGLLGYGLFNWRKKVQPLDDEIKKYELEKLKLEIYALTK